MSKQKLVKYLRPVERAHDPKKESVGFRWDERDQTNYDKALATLKRAKPGDPGYICIAHLDAGIAEHEGIGWTAGAPPENIEFAAGRNTFDAGHGVGAEPDDAPRTPLKRSGGFGAGVVEHPDHGIKTLSVLLAQGEHLEGVVPGARVRPYRCANGPLFSSRAVDVRNPKTKADFADVAPPRVSVAMAEAIDDAIAGPNPCSVVTISMGNPGPGIQTIASLLAEGETGVTKTLGAAVDRAYDKGVIICAAAGQHVGSILYPALFDRTIAVAGYDCIPHKPFLLHYPQQGYIAGAPDIWAQAMRINRAMVDIDSGRRLWASSEEGVKPSGTSYATPQVAGAAALWLARWRTKLDEMFRDRGEAWKVVESFRIALTRDPVLQNKEGASAAEMMTPSEPARLNVRGVSGERTEIRRLNIPALLRVEPPEVDMDKPVSAEAQATGGA